MAVALRPADYETAARLMVRSGKHNGAVFAWEKEAVHCTKSKGRCSPP